jgi:alpha-tubulin suppressor-like RCC1 family protein
VFKILKICSARNFVVTFGAVLLFLTGCTKKNEVARVMLIMPNAISAKPTVTKTKNPVSQSVSASSEDEPEWNTSLNPSLGSDINCFAVFVGGPNLAGNTCSVSDNGAARTIAFGPNIGFVPSGAVIKVDVPAGADRVFHVVGLKSATAAACANYRGTTMDTSNLSEPFLIASQRADIPAGESSLNITASLDVNKKISTCSFVQSGGTGGGGTTISFGDRRDGRMTLTGGNIANFDLGTDPYNLTFPGYSFSPNSGGVAPTKYFSSSVRVTNVLRIGENAGKALTTPAVTTNRFEVGDEVLWHVSGGNANPGPPDDPTRGACGGDLYLGKFGFAKIAGISIGGTLIILDKSISQTPALVKNENLTAAVSNQSGFCRIALTRVPNFEEINVGTGSTLNFYGVSYDSENGTGGTLVMRAKRIVADGSLLLNGSGQGYQGGIGALSAGGTVWGYNGPLGGSSYGSGGGTTATLGGGGGAGGGEGGMMGSAFGSMGGLPLTHGMEYSYTSISAGTNHTCGVSTDGSLRCFGDGSLGQLGAGFQPFSRNDPQQVSGNLTFKSASSGQNHTCAIGFDDRAYCWGQGVFGKLGDGTATSRYFPTMVPDATTYSQISASSRGDHTCAITRDTKKLRCWGFNASYQIGDGSTNDRPSPVDVDSATNYKMVSAGGNHTCAITDAGQLKCWGENAESQLGDGTTNTLTTPTIINAGTSYKRVSAGQYHTCGITSTDQLRCWGAGFEGQLGVGDITGRTTPTPVNGGLTYGDVSVGTYHTCAVTLANQVRCFGDNAAGQIGDTSNTDRLEPTPITGTNTFAKVSVGGSHSCAITVSGQPMCWGYGTLGQLGNGYTSTLNYPSKVRNQSLSLPFADSKSYHGGGGGAGSTPGGRGGGIVLLIAKEILGSGSVQVYAQGDNGVSGAYPSGGGGGGVIGLMSRSLTVDSISLDTSGGDGVGGSFESAGGGGGIVDVQLCSASSSTTPSANVEGGFGGSPALRHGANGSAKRTNFTALCTAD